MDEDGCATILALKGAREVGLAKGGLKVSEIVVTLLFVVPVSDSTGAVPVSLCFPGGAVLGLTPTGVAKQSCQEQEGLY